MLILVLGGFGVGKDTVVDMLVDIIGKDKAYKIPSWTTREPRYKGEDTHNFIWWPGSTSAERNEIFHKEVVPMGVCAAYSIIDYCYYWIEYDQIGNTQYEFYITDKYGARQIMKNLTEEKYFILLIDRPKNLITVESERLNREYTVNTMVGNNFFFDIKPDIIFHNIFMDLKLLKENLFDLADYIQNFE